MKIRISNISDCTFEERCECEVNGKYHIRIALSTIHEIFQLYRQIGYEIVILYHHKVEKLTYKVRITRSVIEGRRAVSGRVVLP